MLPVVKLATSQRHLAVQRTVACPRSTVDNFTHVSLLSHGDLAASSSWYRYELAPELAYRYECRYMAVIAKCFRRDSFYCGTDIDLYRYVDGMYTVFIGHSSRQTCTGMSMCEVRCTCLPYRYRYQCCKFIIFFVFRTGTAYWLRSQPSSYRQLSLIKR